MVLLVASGSEGSCDGAGEGRAYVVDGDAQSVLGVMAVEAATEVK